MLGIGDEVARRRRWEWERWYSLVARARWVSAVWHTLAWTVFGLGYVAAVVFVASGLDASAGAVLLVLAAGARLSGYIGATVGEIGFLRGIWIDGSRRLAWLEDYAAAQVTGDRPAPERIDARHPARGRVASPTPAARRPALEDVDLCAAGRGCGRGRRGERRRQVHAGQAARPDVRTHRGPDPRRRAAARAASPPERGARGWPAPSRTSTASSSPPSSPSGSATSRASTTRGPPRPPYERAGADDVVERLEQGLATQLGPAWTDGVDLSFGQWQKLALARGFMRDDPLLLVLDEPTAALDAETEHALFERYARRPDRLARGGQGRATGRDP